MGQLRSLQSSRKLHLRRLALLILLSISLLASFSTAGPAEPRPKQEGGSKSKGQQQRKQQPQPQQQQQQSASRKPAGKKTKNTSNPLGIRLSDYEQYFSFNPTSLSYDSTPINQHPMYKHSSSTHHSSYSSGILERVGSLGLQVYAPPPFESAAPPPVSAFSVAVGPHRTFRCVAYYDFETLKSLSQKEFDDLSEVTLDKLADAFPKGGDRLKATARELTHIAQASRSEASAARNSQVQEGSSPTPPAALPLSDIEVVEKSGLDPSAIPEGFPIEDIAEMLKAVQVDLNHLTTLECAIYNTGGWWAFELCHGKHVRQFHVEAVPSPDGPNDYVAEITALVNLGDFLQTVLTVTSEEVPGGDSPITALQVVDEYRGGDTCPETGLPRQTSVRYKCCDPDAPGVDARERKAAKTKGAVLQIEEKEVCKYEAVVCANSVCPPAQMFGDEEDEERAAAAAEAAAAAKLNAARPKSPESAKGGIRATLKTALQGLCLQRSEGWWTYEFCHGQKARQYHAKAAPKDDSKGGTSKIVVEVDNTLGNFDPKSTEYPDEEERIRVVNPALTMGLRRAPEDHANLKLSGSYFEEELINGDKCIEKEVAESAVVKGRQSPKGVSRSAMVRYYCGKSLAIAAVEEDATCHYIVSITVPSLCEHELFKKKVAEKRLIKCEEIKVGGAGGMPTSTSDSPTATADVNDANDAPGDKTFSS